MMTQKHCQSNSGKRQQRTGEEKVMLKFRGGSMMENVSLHSQNDDDKSKLSEHVVVHNGTQIQDDGLQQENERGGSGEHWKQDSADVEKPKKKVVELSVKESCSTLRGQIKDSNCNKGSHTGNDSKGKDDQMPFVCGRSGLNEAHDSAEKNNPVETPRAIHKKRKRDLDEETIFLKLPRYELLDRTVEDSHKAYIETCERFKKEHGTIDEVCDAAARKAQSMGLGWLEELEMTEKATDRFLKMKSAWLEVEREKERLEQQQEMETFRKDCRRLGRQIERMVGTILSSLE